MRDEWQVVTTHHGNLLWNPATCLVQCAQAAHGFFQGRVDVHFCAFMRRAVPMQAAGDDVAFERPDDDANSPMTQPQEVLCRKAAHMPIVHPTSGTLPPGTWCKPTAGTPLRRTWATPRSSSRGTAESTRPAVSNRLAHWWCNVGGLIGEDDRSEQRKIRKYNLLLANCLIFHNVCMMTRACTSCAEGVPVGPRLTPASRGGWAPGSTAIPVRRKQSDDTRWRIPLTCSIAGAKFQGVVLVPIGNPQWGISSRILASGR